MFGKKKDQQILQQQQQLEQQHLHIQHLQGELQRLGALEGVQLQSEITQLRQSAVALRDQITSDQLTHQQQMQVAWGQLQQVQNEVVNLREMAAVQEFGLYDYEHPAEHSAHLATELANLRGRIKQMVRDKRTYTASSNFSYNNSLAKGRTFTDNMAKTMLAAYNSEVENAIKSAKAGSYVAAMTRLNKMVERIARNGKMVDLQITSGYHRLRLQELQLAVRYQDAVKAEREAERERKSELREQQRAEAELRKERERLEKERSHYLNVLQALQARGDHEQAAQIQAQLLDVDSAIQNVDYRAANIQAGYVYVISNIGAMGPNIVKIGMTRRLEPTDRIRELSDASVPFPFDVHAMFFADNAVAIEAMLHREFADKRVNLINQRREFFYCTPDQVLEKLKAHGVSLVEYTAEPDAEQYRLSQATRKEASPAGS